MSKHQMKPASAPPATPSAPPSPPPPEPRQARPGFVLLRANGASGCSVKGASYAADADGLVEVPVADAGDLLAHGFTAAPPAAT